MAPLRWTTLTWEQFTAELRGFRDRFYVGRTDEEHAYLAVREKLEGRSYAEIAELTDDIVWFLNRWACRLPARAASTGLSDWIRTQTRTLEDQTDVSIFDPRVIRRQATYLRLHDGLLRLKRQGVPNMSDAAASKVLHQLNPALFVMWDRNIRPYADNYGSFVATMHALSCRLRDSAPAAAQADPEAFLQAELGYPVKKTMAKYLDEYNWYVAFGRERIAP